MNSPINLWQPKILATNTMTVIVVGAGPVGVRFIDELKRRGINCKVILFGNETYDPYNRVQLSSLLSREKDYEDLVSELPTSTEHFQFEYISQHVESIIPDQHLIVTKEGQRYSYDHLVLATGSTPHLPDIPGAKMTGVYCFRNMKDTEHLAARNVRARRVVVVGGGLLGLEAAKAMSKFNTDVSVLQQAERLMNRQLDEKASSILQSYLDEAGIKTYVSSGVRKVIGESRVEGVVTRDGDTIYCDTVIFCTGIRPQTSLALSAGINVAQGIKINDYLQTSKQDVYAIGECSEHKGMVYGLVAPGLEQASVLADRLSGGSAIYQGTQLISTLKVVGTPVCSMGEVAEVTRRAKQTFLEFYNKKTRVYRKLIIHQGRIIGGCAVGEWPESRRIQEAYLSKSYINPWQRFYFKLTGNLWQGDVNKSVAQWPETSIVCQCNQISRGAITASLNQGCQSLEAIGKDTGAGTVCGSCQPLIQNLLGEKSQAIETKGGFSIALASVIAIAACLFLYLFPGFTPISSVQEQSFEFLWTDGYWKQVTGFTLIGFVAFGLFMSLRKRFGWKFLGNFSYWRIIHVVVGLLTLGILLAHTGADLGENLNKWLMLNFLLISFIGALAGISLWLAGKMAADFVQQLKKAWYWIHLVVVWPLPALLIAHVVSVYYF